MKESIFGEFQYFIKRINAFRSGGSLAANETIEDLEQRFRVQIERGLVVHEPHSQEVVMEVLLSDLPENAKRKHILEVRRTGDTDFELKNASSKVMKSNQGLTLEQKKEKALDLMITALKKVGVKTQKQPLAVKMFMAEYELGEVDYDDPKDLKLLFVKTVQISGHAKKAEPEKLAKVFSEMLV
jgi:hypothetical protein